MVNTLAQTNTKIAGDALTKDAGAEVLALRKKADNDNALSQNFGDRQNRGNAKRKVLDKPSTSSNVVPFRPKPRPDDGSAGGVTTSVATNKTETNPEKLVESSFYKPGGIPTSSNDNQPRSTVNNETTSKKTQEPEVRDIRRLDQRVQDAIGTPELLPKDASANLSGQLAESINDPTKIRDKDSEDGRDPQYEYLNFDNDNENFDNSEIERLNNQITISEDILDDTLNENDKDEERITAHKVNFPFLMFVLSLLEWILLLILSLVAIVLTFILPPVGLIIGTSIRFWKIAFRVFISSWCIFYEKKEIANVKKLFSKSKRIAQISTRKSISTYTIWIFTILPFIGDIFPYNTYSVWESYSKLKKTIRKY